MYPSARSFLLMVWLLENTCFLINNPVLSMACLALQSWTSHLTRIRFDCSMVVACLDPQGEISCLTNCREADQLSLSVGISMPALCFVPGMETWQVGLFCQCLDSGEWPSLWGVLKFCFRWGMVDVDLLAFRFSYEINRFAFSSRDHLAFTVHSLVLPLDQFYLI